MKLIIKCFFLIVLLNFLACKNEVKTEEVKTTVKVDTLANQFQYKLKNEKKIFLKYWSGMSVDDFYNVSELLYKEGILTTTDHYYFSYVTGECSVKINAIYTNNKLREITLNDNETCLYPYFIKKYKLPKTVYKNTLYSNYYGDNTEYSPLLTYTKNKQIYRVPSSLIETSNHADFTEDEGDKSINENVYPFENYVLDKEYFVIIFKQEFIEDKIPLKTYSLSLNAEAMKIKDQINGGSYNFDEGIRETHIARNSKKVNIKKRYYVQKRIVFLDKKIYLDSLNEIKKDILLKKKSKDSLINRSKNISNEI